MAVEHLVLLPGMMCDARLWAEQIRDLDIDCHVPQLTGSRDFAELAQRILDDAPDEFALAGLSMGGIIAFELWRQAPERISHLAILDSNPFPDTSEKKTNRLEQIQIALHGGLRELAVEQLKPLYLAESRREDKALLQIILDMALELGPKVFEDQSLALRARHDSTETLGTINVPTTVICGVEDRLCPVKLHEYMAENIPDAKLVVIDDCGHLSSTEQPDIVTRELRELLQKDAAKETTNANQLRPDSHDARR